MYLIRTHGWTKYPEKSTPQWDKDDLKEFNKSAKSLIKFHKTKSRKHIKFAVTLPKEFYHTDNNI